MEASLPLTFANNMTITSIIQALPPEIAAKAAEELKLQLADSIGDDQDGLLTPPEIEARNLLVEGHIQLLDHVAKRAR